MDGCGNSARGNNSHRTTRSTRPRSIARRPKCTICGSICAATYVVCEKRECLWADAKVSLIMNRERTSATYESFSAFPHTASRDNKTVTSTSRRAVAVLSPFGYFRRKPQHTHTRTSHTFVAVLVRRELLAATALRRSATVCGARTFAPSCDRSVAV